MVDHGDVTKMETLGGKKLLSGRGVDRAPSGENVWVWILVEMQQARCIRQQAMGACGRVTWAFWMRGRDLILELERRLALGPLLKPEGDTSLALT